MSSEKQTAKKTLHSRNKHIHGYNFDEMVVRCPELDAFLITSKYGHETIDFSNPNAVIILNKALLLTYYDIEQWDIPRGFLCPPIPGRVDYIHYLADLLSEGNNGKIPTGSKTNILDVGIGANAIYPILGQREYGWHFLGTDVNRNALNFARNMIFSNQNLRGTIQCKVQKEPEQVFKGILDEEGLYFHAAMCNPPFHSSAEEAAKGTDRKLKNLHGDDHTKARLNFGGKSQELWCPGGELTFISNMIFESRLYSKKVGWFTTIVSKKDHLFLLQRMLTKSKVADSRVIDMHHGNKVSRILAWRF